MFKQPKAELDIPDEYSQMLLIRHLYLQEICKGILKDGTKKYHEIELLEEEISEAIIKEWNLTKSEVGQNVSYLVADGYIYLTSPDRKTNMKVRIAKKGFIAVTDGEFKQKHDSRQLQLRTLEELKKSIISHDNQKFTNGMLIFATILTAIVPFIVALIFTTKVYNTNVLPAPIYRPDIRIDSVWLQKQVDEAIQKSISTPTPTTTTTKQPSK